MNDTMNAEYKAALKKAKSKILAAAKKIDEGRNAVSSMKKQGFTEAGVLSLLISRLYTKSQVEQIIDDLLMGCYDCRPANKSGSVRILVEMLTDDLNDC